MNTTTAPGGEQPALERARASSFSTSRSAVRRHHAPEQRQRAGDRLRCGVAARIGAAGRQRREQPRRLALARHRDDRVGLPGRRQRDRRFAQRAAVTAAGRIDRRRRR